MIRKYRAGSLIAHSGEQLKALIMVVSGAVKGEMADYTGRAIKIEDIVPPHLLASAFLFGNNNRFPVNVTALCDTELLIIGKADFLVLLKKNNTVLANFLDIISNRSQFLSEKIKFLSFKTIKGKLAQYILQGTTAERPSIRLKMTQSDLADYFGVARPSVARALSDMEKEGVIEATGKSCRVLDRERLARLTND
jgi:CRP-like cAMP-binding protein